MFCDETPGDQQKSDAVQSIMALDITVISAYNIVILKVLS